jgi:hypothetical protein
VTAVQQREQNEEEQGDHDEREKAPKLRGHPADVNSYV